MEVIISAVCLQDTQGRLGVESGMHGRRSECILGFLAGVGRPSAWGKPGLGQHRSGNRECLGTGLC